MVGVVPSSGGPSCCCCWSFRRSLDPLRVGVGVGVGVDVDARPSPSPAFGLRTHSAAARPSPSPAFGLRTHSAAARPSPSPAFGLRTHSAAATHIIPPPNNQNHKLVVDYLSSTTTTTTSSGGGGGGQRLNNLGDLVTGVKESLKAITKAASESGDSAVEKMSKLSSEMSSKAASASIEVLRSAVVSLENSIAKGASFLVYSYDSAKDSLPPQIKDTLNLSQQKAAHILAPLASAIQQVFIGIRGLETSLGFDPDDPLVSLLLFLGTSASLWVFYWVWAYGGYSGDLSPHSTLQLLAGEDNAILIDVRSEVLREREGIPDLRRAARFRYANITLPELDGSISKLLRGGREVDDALIAAVIKNLKIVQDRSKVIVMDADGTRSKGIARSLRKFGVRRPYLVKGGFQSWTKQGLRVKELKPETALTILNEEAEAILEEIKPSPVQALGYGVGFVAALYALLEWEKTLQLTGIVGLGLTIYSRIASYEKPDDLKQDVRLLLTPVKLGADAFSWAAGKLETNGMRLPLSPSSSDVQNRVLQAAAKHESQPSDVDGMKSTPSELVTPMNENVDLSEA